MEKQIITFSANEQRLIKTGGIECYASNIVSYIEAHFDLGANWSGYDSVRAVWSNDNNMTVISTVLDSNGVCVVPFEVLKTKGIVKVNLVGSISVSDVLTDRLTTFPCEAVKVTAKAKIEGSETQPITPSQFEQFVAIVQALVGSVRDIDRIELNDDYTLTIYYSDGTSDTTSSIRGATGNGIASIAKTGSSGSNPVVDTYTVTYTDGNTFTFTVTNGIKGDTGNGISKIEKTGSSGTNPVIDTYRITYTNGQTFSFTVTNGVKGDTGNGIASIDLTSTSGAVKTYTITFTDGTTTTFEVTDGEVTNASMKAYVDPQFADLKSALSHCLEIIPSKNLYNPANKMDGYQLYSNGSVATNSSYNFTGYIDIENCEKITVMFRDFLYPGTSTQNAFYDSSKSPVTTRNELGSVVYGTAKTFTVPSGAKYFGVAYMAEHLKSNSTIMVQSGETATDYEPYGDTYVVLPSNETINARGGYNTLDERIDAIAEGSEKPYVVEYWGDSLTQGNQDGSGIGRRTVLAQLLGDSWSVKNYGVGGEQSNTVATRQSAMTAIVKAGQSIPADTSDTVLEIVDQNGDALNFRSCLISSAYAGWGTVNPCYIAGVKGNLTRNGSSYSTVSWKFNRLESGDAVSIDRPTGIKMNSQTFDKNPVMIICIGQNEGWNREPTEIVAQVKAMIEQAKAERYLVIGMPHTKSYTWQIAGNEALNLEFGKHYIDIEAYMKTPIYDVDGTTIISSYALSDAGLTPTASDLTAIANNSYPPSIMYDGVHFNQYGYTVWANREYKVGQWLGYW